MYDSPHQFEPTLLGTIPPATLELAEHVARLSRSLSANTPEQERSRARTEIRMENARWSNAIEGLEIDPEPHAAAERELESLVAAGARPASSAFLLAAHQTLFSRLAPAELQTASGHPIKPGSLRELDVAVGWHVPPVAISVPRFLRRMDDVYDRPPMSVEMQLIVAACAHHRAAWVHPFIAGNGRAIRLQTTAMLWPISEGLWSVSRALARSRSAYFTCLHNADQPRQGARDGRGNLTARGLLAWIEFFLGACQNELECDSPAR